MTPHKARERLRLYFYLQASDRSIYRAGPRVQDIRAKTIRGQLKMLMRLSQGKLLRLGLGCADTGHVCIRTLHDARARDTMTNLGDGGFSSAGGAAEGKRLAGSNSDGEGFKYSVFRPRRVREANLA